MVEASVATVILCYNQFVDFISMGSSGNHWGHAPIVIGAHIVKDRGVLSEILGEWLRLESFFTTVKNIRSNSLPILATGASGLWLMSVVGICTLRIATWTTCNNGDYWSCTAYSSANAYNLNMNPTGVNPSNNWNRYGGFSLRCVPGSVPIFGKVSLLPGGDVFYL